MPMIGGAIIVALFTKPVMLAMFRAVAIIVGLASGPAFILLVVRSLNSRDAQNRGEQKSSASVGFFGRNEFASIGFSAFALCVMAVLFPPWVKVRADWAMSGFGFGSHEVKVHETHFAGYDALLSTAKRQQEIRSPAHTPGANYEFTYCRVLKPLLVAEWIAICATARAIYRRRALSAGAPKTAVVNTRIAISDEHFLNTDNEYRKFRFVEAVDATDFLAAPEGWLEFAERASPNSPKALLEGDYVACLPDGRRFFEISFKRGHRALDETLAAWASSVSRRYAWLTERHFVISDGTALPIDDVKWERLK